MPYNIGQVRRDQIQSYTTDLGYTTDKQVNESAEVEIEFYDPCMKLTTPVDSTTSYYLQFEVTQTVDTDQEFNIKLLNSQAEEDNTQQVRNFIVKKGNEGKTTFELIFRPNGTYNIIVFQLKRIAGDYISLNPDGSSGRFMKVNVLKFCSVTNIISSYLSTTYEGLTSLKKIGIQGPPGLIFSIEGEEMHIGRSGIYELHEGDISVTSIGFIIKESSFTQDGKDFFIMDFKY